MHPEDIPNLARTMRGLWPAYAGWPWEDDVWAIWAAELRGYAPGDVAAAIRRIAKADPGDFPPNLGRVQRVARIVERERLEAHHSRVQTADRILEAHANGSGWPWPWDDVPTEHLAAQARGVKQNAKEAHSHAERGR